MAMTKAALEGMILDFNSRGEKPHGRLLTLSRYILGFDSQFFNEVCAKYGWDGFGYDALRIDDKQLFSAMGFESIETMDYSDYEGSGITYDLNNPNVPANLLERYDYILDGGTLEHVFHLPNALETVFKMLKVGGTFFFNQPAFFGINHGFYNISPCLYYEYFLVNKWKMNRFNVLLGNDVSVMEYGSRIDMSEQDIRSGYIKNIREGHFMYMWASVTKLAESTHNVIPQQPFYMDLWGKTNSGGSNINEILHPLRGKVFLYGTGAYAASLVDELNPGNKEKLKSGGMLSALPDEIGKYFYDVKIHDISIVKQGDNIVIASADYRDIIYDRIKHLEKEGIAIFKL